MTEKYIKRLFVLKDLGINIPSGYDVIYTYLCENYSRITVEDEKYLYRNIYFNGTYKGYLKWYDFVYFPTESILFELCSIFKLSEKDTELILECYIKHKLNL